MEAIRRTTHDKLRRRSLSFNNSVGNEKGSNEETKGDDEVLREVEQIEGADDLVLCMGKKRDSVTEPCGSIQMI